MTFARGAINTVKILPVLVLILSIVEKGCCLKCFKCSHNQLTDRGNLGSFYEWFKSVADNQHCTLEQEGDRDVFRPIECPEEDGKLAKCVEIRGDVTTTTSFFTDLEIKYNTITRDCILVMEEDAHYSDGCHTEFPSPGPVRDILQTVFQSNVIKTLKFDGSVCYGTQSLFVTTSGAEMSNWRRGMMSMFVCLFCALKGS